MYFQLMVHKHFHSTFKIQKVSFHFPLSQRVVSYYVVFCMIRSYTTRHKHKWIPSKNIKFLRFLSFPLFSVCPLFIFLRCTSAELRIIFTSFSLSPVSHSILITLSWNSSSKFCAVLSNSLVTISHILICNTRLSVIASYEKMFKTMIFFS